MYFFPKAEIVSVIVATNKVYIQLGDTPMNEYTKTVEGIVPLDESQAKLVAGGGTPIGAIGKLAVAVFQIIFANATKGGKVTKFAGFGDGPGGSDRRIKTDIEKVGHLTELGVDLYAWCYRNDDPTRYVGVMAQDLLARSDLAHAVVTAEAGEFQGFYAVDYQALGLRMITEAEWRAKGLSAVYAPIAACG